MASSTQLFNNLVAGCNTALNEFWLEAARGNIKGIHIMDVTGRATDVAGNKVEVWAESSTYTFPMSASIITMSSSDTEDNLSGAGARTARVDGLDSNFSRLIEILHLSGTTQVSSTGSFYRVNHVEIETVGSHQGNRGIVKVHHGANVLSHMTSGSCHDWNGIYTVPSGSLGFIKRVYANTGKDSTARWTVAIRHTTGSAWHPVRDMEIYRAHVAIDLPYAWGNNGMLPAGTDVKFSVQRIDGAAPMTVVVGAIMALVDANADDNVGSIYG